MLLELTKGVRVRMNASTSRSMRRMAGGSGTIHPARSSSSAPVVRGTRSSRTTLASLAKSASSLSLSGPSRTSRSAVLNARGRGPFSGVSRGASR